MSDYNRYSNYSKNKLPRQKMSVLIKGIDEDRGKYYRCWNCGFICNKDRNSLGGSKSRNGTFDESFNEPMYVTEYEFTADPKTLMVVTDGLASHHETLMEYGPDGVIKNIELPYKADVTKGCPLCGSTNYR